MQYKDCFGIELFEGSLVDHKFPWHFHPQYNIVLVEDGIMSYNFAEGQVDVGQNQLFIVNPFEVHSNKPRTSSCTYKAIFLPQFFLTNHGERGLPFFMKKYKLECRLIQRIAILCGQPKKFYQNSGRF